MYKNHVEYLIYYGDCMKACRKTLLLLQMSAVNPKRVQCYQDLNKDLQNKINRYLTQKLNVVNEVLATEETSEYHITKTYSYLHRKLQVEIRARERAQDDLIDIEATLKLIIIGSEKCNAFAISDMKRLQYIFQKNLQ